MGRRRSPLFRGNLGADIPVSQTVCCRYTSPLFRLWNSGRLRDMRRTGYPGFDLRWTTLAPLETISMSARCCVDKVVSGFNFWSPWYAAGMDAGSSLENHDGWELLQAGFQALWSFLLETAGKTEICAGLAGTRWPGSATTGKSVESIYIGLELTIEGVLGLVPRITGVIASWIWRL